MIENTFPLEFSQPQPHKERGTLIGGKIGNSEAQGIPEGKRQVGLYGLPPKLRMVRGQLGNTPKNLNFLNHIRKKERSLLLSPTYSNWFPKEADHTA